MSAATPIPWSESAARGTGSGFRSIFEHAPFPAARCNPQGIFLETNSAFDQMLARSHSRSQSQRLSDLVPLQDHAATDSLLRDLLTGVRENICLKGKPLVSGQPGMRWTAWRAPASAHESVFLITESNFVANFSSNAASNVTPNFLQYSSPASPLEENSQQAERWEAVGRLAGGVVHDFNNLLTGVMLYCDLLLSSLPQAAPSQRDRRYRTYAEEIRSAVAQAAGLIRQLLVFSRPKPIEVRPLCLNQVAQAMRDLLSRLIGENIALDLRLDPELGLVTIDAVQAQQILLNLILNARDAMPTGGRIVVETSNCKFQTLTGSAPGRAANLPCIMLSVADNGTGMDAATRGRLFEPFFTTKHASKGTGLGLTTVRSIVSANRGLIHVESELGRGTRIMVLLPRASATDTSLSPLSSFESSHPAPQKTKKELPL